MKRTHTCGELNASHIGQEVVLMGWVHVHRNLGGCVFIDLRDRYGITQVNVDPQRNQDVDAVAATVRSEWVIGISGSVISRGDNINRTMPTGEIEIAANAITIFNKSQTPRFQIRDGVDANEDLKLQYRYLDLRRPELQSRIVARSLIGRAFRQALESEGFLELETPILTRSTPEGARDYLVPSRIAPGHLYALPQSPQLFKQLYMIAGYDKYYQVCRCFRDEDLRADRQPEFTQVDMEMSFCEMEDVLTTTERVTAHVFKEAMGLDISLPVKRITYDEAMARFGLDAPDLRFKMELSDVSDAFENSAFRAFSQVVDSGGIVKALNVVGGESLSRKQLDGLSEFVRSYGAKGVAWVKIKADGWTGPLAKHIPDEAKTTLTERLELNPGDLVLLIADTLETANQALGRLRVHLAKMLGLIDKAAFEFVWVTDFPAFEYDDESGRYIAVHHPFTSPRPEDLERLESDPGSVKTLSYDLVLNGTEMAGGSIRIHDTELQQRIFRLLGIGEQEAKDKFGFLLDALQFGAPPHGGLAFGFDRAVMLITGASSIRDIIAFPKTTKATCLMTNAPSPVDEKQLTELGLKELDRT